MSTTTSLGLLSAEDFTRTHVMIAQLPGQPRSKTCLQQYATTLAKIHEDRGIVKGSLPSGTSSILTPGLKL